MCRGAEFCAPTSTLMTAFIHACHSRSVQAGIHKLYALRGVSVANISVFVTHHSGTRKYLTYFDKGLYLKSFLTLHRVLAIAYPEPGF